MEKEQKARAELYRKYTGEMKDFYSTYCAVYQDNSFLEELLFECKYRTTQTNQQTTDQQAEIETAKDTRHKVPPSMLWYCLKTVLPQEMLEGKYGKGQRETLFKHFANHFVNSKGGELKLSSFCSEYSKGEQPKTADKKDIADVKKRVKHCLEAFHKDR